ncbi:Energy-coupling factor transporter ATP-binding protein EcfA2 [compost metagenome]
MPVIELSHVSFRYSGDRKSGEKALDDISLTVDKGEFIAIVGENGSGKSTLVQHMNGLLCPDEGEVTVLGGKTSDVRHRSGLWRRVGLLFQYPERQLFEETVIRDVSYGLRNMGVDEAEAAERAAEALSLTGLDAGKVGFLSPLALSGGQRRRAAFAGILAMRPEILILDEPTAGLDGPGRSGLLSLVKRLQQEMGCTIVMVSHSIREAGLLADRLYLLSGGKLAAVGQTGETLTGIGSAEWDECILPEYMQVLQRLAKRGYPVSPRVASREEALEQLLMLIREGRI